MKTILSLFVIVSLISPAFSAEKGSAKKAPAKAEKKESSGESKVPAAAQKAADSLSEAQQKKLLEILNDGDDKALASLPGIGETRAAAVKKARPIKEVTSLLAVDGIGDGTFNEIIAHAKAGFPGSEAKAPATKKTETSSTKGKKKKASTGAKSTK